MSSEDRSLRAAAVVVTVDRPDYVATGPDRLREQSRSAEVVVVVDSPCKRRTERLVAACPDDVDVRDSNGHGLRWAGLACCAVAGVVEGVWFRRADDGASR